MIRFACPQCGANINAPDEAAGKSAGCPRCSSTVHVPGSHAPATAAAFAEPERESELAVENPPTVEEAPRKQRGPKPRERYRVLRTFSIACLVTGILCLVISPIIFCLGLSEFNPRDFVQTFRNAFIGAFGMLSLGVAYFVTGELIVVFLDIEKNTRQIAENTKRDDAESE